MAVLILIKVKNLQRQDEEENNITYETRGYLYQKGQATYLQYSEGSEGLEGVQTTLKLEKDRVTLIRHGNIAMHQIFDVEVADEGLYQTPYGSLDIRTDTHSIDMNIGSEEGQIRIRYDLYLAGELSSQNTMQVTYQSTYEEEQ